MESERDEEIVVLTKAQGDFDAQLLRGVLESEGIEAMIKLGVSQNVYPLTVNGLGEIRVCVFRRDLERAREVLDAYRQDP